MTPRTCIIAGALLAASGVALGAFGAHGLHDRLVESDGLENWRTAVRYLVWHALALILLGIRRETRALAPATAWLFLVGAVLFSGSIFLLSLELATSIAGPVTPLGGALLLAGWIAWAVSELRAS